MVNQVLHHPLLYRVSEILFTSNKPLHSSEVGKMIGIRQDYAYMLLKKLEKWGIAEPLKDPTNGKTMFRPSTKRIAKLLAEEIRKRKIDDLVIIDEDEDTRQRTRRKQSRETD